MARKRMITRTIKQTEVTLLCLDITKAEPFNETISLVGSYTDDIKILKIAGELLNNPEVKVVHVVSKKETEELYGMTETEFIEKAKVLDPKTHKILSE